MKFTSNKARQLAFGKKTNYQLSEIVFKPRFSQWLPKSRHAPLAATFHSYARSLPLSLSLSLSLSVSFRVRRASSELAKYEICHTCTICAFKAYRQSHFAFACLRASKAPYIPRGKIKTERIRDAVPDQSVAARTCLERNRDFRFLCPKSNREIDTFSERTRERASERARSYINSLTSNCRRVSTAALERRLKIRLGPSIFVRVNFLTSNRSAGDAGMLEARNRPGKVGPASRPISAVRLVALGGFSGSASKGCRKIRTRLIPRRRRTSAINGILSPAARITSAVSFLPSPPLSPSAMYRRVACLSRVLARASTARTSSDAHLHTRPFPRPLRSRPHHRALTRVVSRVQLFITETLHRVSRHRRVKSR